MFSQCYMSMNKAAFRGYISNCLIMLLFPKLRNIFERYSQEFDKFLFYMEIQK